MVLLLSILGEAGEGDVNSPMGVGLAAKLTTWLLLFMGEICQSYKYQRNEEVKHLLACFCTTCEVMQSSRFSLMMGRALRYNYIIIIPFGALQHTT